MLFSCTAISFRSQTRILWYVTFIYCCILQVSDTDTVVCYFHILLYPSGLRHGYCGMFFSCTAVSFMSQTRILWYVIFMYCSILQVSDTDTVVCYFNVLRYPSCLRRGYCGMLFSCTAVSFRSQTRILWYVTFIYYCILQVSDTDTLVRYFHVLLYPSGLRHGYCGMLLSYTVVSFRSQTRILWYVIFMYGASCNFKITNILNITVQIVIFFFVYCQIPLVSAAYSMTYYCRTVLNRPHVTYLPSSNCTSCRPQWPHYLRRGFATA